MTGRCLWVDRDRDDEVHHVCPDEAVGRIETKIGFVPLCERHKVMAEEEGIGQ